MFLINLELPEKGGEVKFYEKRASRFAEGKPSVCRLFCLERFLSIKKGGTTGRENIFIYLNIISHSLLNL